MKKVTENEKLKRDLYLKDLNSGKIQGPLTGNIFHDKVWTLNFSENSYSNFNIYDTLYNTFKEYALKHLNDKAVYVQKTNQKYTYCELLELVNITSNALTEKGVNQSSRVGLFLNSSIEDPIFLLALSKIGALSKWFDAFKDPKEIIESLHESNYDLLVVDEAMLPLEQFVNQNNIPVIVANAEKKYKNDKYIDFASFYQIKTDKIAETVSFNEKRASIIINSSGTTGPSKPITHTDSSINAAAQKVMYTDFPLGNNNVMLKMVPSQIGLGLVTSMYTSLISGTQVAMVSGNSIEEMAMNMIKFVRDFPQYRKENGLPEDAKLNIFTAPIQIRQLMKSEMITDLSFIGSIMVGGSKLEKEELEELEEIGRKKGLTVPICVGYGQNELAGGASYNCNSSNKNGSAGFPAIGVDIIIVDVKTQQIVNINEEGHILERSDSEFLCYDKREEKTNSARITLPDGTTWFQTYDLGYMDKDGFLFITGRIGRSATRFDVKVSLDTIQGKIKTLNMINDCATINPNYGGSFEDIIAYVVLNDDIENIKTLIQSANILSVFEMPTEFIAVKQIPYLSSGKPNYEILKEQYFKNSKARLRIKSEKD